MKRPYIIAINSISGGGKTTLAKLLQESLPTSVVFCFDDFDETNVYPKDFYEWWKRGADLHEFDRPGMRKAVDEEIERGATEFIILDYPFGRDHRSFETLIDLSVFVDTPLDVAMTRRIIRDYCVAVGETADKVLERLRAELAHYVEKARYPYLDTDRHKPGSDLILDGWRSLLELRDEVLERGKASMIVEPSVRRFTPHEWPLYRNLRLSALTDSPDAFGRTLSEEHARTDAEWANRLESGSDPRWNLPLIAEVGGEPTGLAWGRIEISAPDVANLYQMWVAAKYRGRGTGRILLETVIEWARAQNARYLDLGVTSGDTPAMRLYLRAGFQPVGELQALRPGSGLWAQPMRLQLTR